MIKGGTYFLSISVWALVQDVSAQGVAAEFFKFWGQRQTAQLEMRLDLEKHIICVSGFSHDQSDKHFSFLLEFDNFVM